MFVSADKQIKDTLSGQASLLSELVAQALEPALTDVGLTFSMFELLTTIRACGTEASQADVARRLGITPPSLTEAVRLAVKSGVVEQRPSKTDGRSKTLALTTVGTKKLQKTLEAVNQAEKTLVNGIKQQDLQTAVLVLKAASRNLARGLMESQN